MRMRVAFLILLALTCLGGGTAAMLPSVAAAAEVSKNLIYDEAELLSTGQREELNRLANQYGADRQTDIIIYISSNVYDEDVVKLTEDFYDEQGPGYDKSHGNAVILTLDTRNRDVYLASFYKAEDYLDDGRLDRIRSRITPYLTEGDYVTAFREYIKTANRYLGVRPGANPDNPLFNLWVQLGAALVIGGVTVLLMSKRSGGRVTVNGQTYEDRATTSVLNREDRYIRTTVTRHKIQKNNNSGSGGGGGGMTGGGHSHSGSRGSY